MKLEQTAFQTDGLAMAHGDSGLQCSDQCGFLFGALVIIFFLEKLLMYFINILRKSLDILVVCSQQASLEDLVHHIPRSDIPIKLFTGFVYHTCTAKFKIKPKSSKQHTLNGAQSLGNRST